MSLKQIHISAQFISLNKEIFFPFVFSLDQTIGAIKA